ncbi:MAG TPA: EAL domain-containing protein [Gemmatimonadaceae bacterium]|nr:EAL domain-containing protein [Gemmatimonadaceae bacterium]
MIARARRLVRRRSTTLLLVGYALVSVATGAFSLLQLRSAARESHRLYDGLVSGLDLLAGLQFDVQEARRRMLYALTTTDANLQVAYADESRAADERVKQRMAQHIAQLSGPGEIAAANRFQEDWGEYLRIRDEVIASILEGQTAAAIDTDLELGTPTFDRARADLLAMQDRYKTDAELRRQDAEEAADQSFQLVIVVLLLSQLIVIFGLRAVQAGDMLARERRSQARLSEIIESIDEGMLVLGRDGRVQLWNAAAERLSRRTRADVLGQKLAVAWPPLARTALGGTLASSLADRAVGATRLAVHLADVGGDRVLDVRTFPFEDGITLFFTDQTNLTRRTEDLSRTASLLGATLESTADGILATDGMGHITLFNRRFVELWRIPKDIAESRDDDRAMAHMVRQLRDPEAFLRKVHELYASPEAESFDELEFNDGRVFERYSVPQRVDGGSAGRVWSFRDVTQRKAAERQLLHDAFHDALTFLPNRSRFTELLRRSIGRARLDEQYSFAMLFLDLDRFKVVNDSLGHAVGDQLLVAVARRLEQCVRPGDTVARLGGDEFTVLIDNTSGVNDATRVAERIMIELQRPFFLQGQDVFVSASIGIALSSTGYQMPDDLLRDADLAMYRAKANGKSRYEVFDQRMHAHAVALLQLETDLRLAIEREEFRILYQPVISMRSGRIAGVEALVRWEHPQRGLVSPDDFLHVAEETGLVVPMGNLVLREACMRMAEWRRENPVAGDVTISVNLSARQFSHPDLLSRVIEALQASGLPPRCLRLEFTESVLIEREGPVIDTFAKLHALGIRLDLDDFGTGYSSLGYLHRFDLDGLKIDRSFVSNIGPDGERSEIVRTIVALANNLGMEVIAEGVETPGQATVLQGVGCDLVQGYLFGGALSADEMAERFSADVLV